MTEAHSPEGRLVWGHTLKNKSESAQIIILGDWLRDLLKNNHDLSELDTLRCLRDRHLIDISINELADKPSLKRLIIEFNNEWSKQKKEKSTLLEEAKKKLDDLYRQRQNGVYDRDLEDKITLADMANNLLKRYDN